MARRTHHRRSHRTAGHRRLPPHLGGPGKKKASPLALALVGGGAALGLFLLLRKTASAAQIPAGGGGGGGGQLPPVNRPPPINPTVPLLPGMTATVVTVNPLNVRDQPSTSGRVLGQLLPGNVVTILEAPTATGWVKVRVPGNEGFVCNTCAQLNDVGVEIREALRANPPTGNV